MLSTYKHIYFDLDGTISDSFPGIENGIRFAFNQLNIQPLTTEEIKSIIGIPLQDSLKPFLKDEPELIADAVQLFRSYYQESGITESYLYYGIESLLATLSKNACIYIVTAKPTAAAEQLLESHRVAQYFSKICGYTPGQSHFSKAGLIRQIGNMDNAIMIGDKKQDIEAGKLTNISTCAVTYGYGTLKEIHAAEPDFVAHSVEQLKNLLLQHAVLAV